MKKIILACLLMACSLATQAQTSKKDFRETKRVVRKVLKKAESIMPVDITLPQPTTFSYYNNITTATGQVTAFKGFCTGYNAMSFKKDSIDITFVIKRRSVSVYRNDEELTYKTAPPKLSKIIYEQLFDAVVANTVNTVIRKHEFN